MRLCQQDKDITSALTWIYNIMINMIQTSSKLTGNAEAWCKSAEPVEVVKENKLEKTKDN